MKKIEFNQSWSLYDSNTTRALERAWQAELPPHTLMQRAGLSVARLALAIAPHSQHIWIACGSGNNGGDGMEAAIHLKQWGKSPTITCMGNPSALPADALASFHRAAQAGVTFAASPPADFDLCIDALLGTGGTARPPVAPLPDWINQINASTTPVLAVDLPSGLNPNTGVANPLTVRATHCLSLLTLKPGLFTGQGRDAAGEVWFDDLDCDVLRLSTTAKTNLLPNALLAGERHLVKRLHASHKGSYGDVAVIGGAAGMTGAALLAANASLKAGAGRVFVCLLDRTGLSVDLNNPELMFRTLDALDLSCMSVVCGCGGAQAVREPLAKILSTANRLVVDADALNAIAADQQLQTLLIARNQRQAITVLTPHPLEAARLLSCTTGQIQNDRLQAANELAHRFACTVVLKGSGTVIASPGETTVINSTGNARLATAGTGDVLAGMIGAALASQSTPAFMATTHAVYRHGQIADQWPPDQPFTAGSISSML